MICLRLVRAEVTVVPFPPPPPRTSPAVVTATVARYAIVPIAASVAINRRVSLLSRRTCPTVLLTTIPRHARLPKAHDAIRCEAADGTVFFLDRSLGVEPIRKDLIKSGLEVEIHDDHFARDEKDRVLAPDGRRAGLGCAHQGSETEISSTEDQGAASQQRQSVRPYRRQSPWNRDRCGPPGGTTTDSQSPPLPGGTVPWRASQHPDTSLSHDCHTILIPGVVP